MKLGLILTNDWELYGDGSGDYFELQHRPLEALLKAVESHGARLTVMAEAGQQWAHRRLGEQEAWAQEIASGWEAILKETVARKSDVQLHLHPQWLNARYENNRWQVDLSQWSLSSLPGSVTEKVLKEGKQYLDSLLQPVDPDYECIAFRAGNYCMQPSPGAVLGLLKAGFICDSSVTRGMYAPQYYDYRGACSSFLPWFASPDNIKYRNAENKGLLEIPIYSYETYVSLILRELFPQLANIISFGVGMSRRDRMWLSRNNKEKLKKYPLRSRPLMGRNIRSVRWLLSVIIARSAVQLDYDKLPPNVFVRLLQKIHESREVEAWRDKEVIIPVVASGHVKGMYNCENIERILDAIKAYFKDSLTFWTLGEAARYWVKRAGTDSREAAPGSLEGGKLRP